MDICSRHIVTDQREIDKYQWYIDFYKRTINETINK